MPNINTILKSIKKSQEDLAKKVGCSQGSINHYANGNRTPSYEMAWKVVDALNSLGANCTFYDVFPNPVETSSKDEQTTQPVITG